MMPPQNEIVGYWLIESAPDDSSERAGEVYLHFTEDNVLQWGYENRWRICVISYNYQIECNYIQTTCPPNTRKEFSEFSFTKDGKLKLFYSNYETIWVKTHKQDFFESKNIWNPGILHTSQENYMEFLNSKPHPLEIKRAEYLGVSPQIIINTAVLWESWRYSRAAFAKFHFEDFKYILEQGVLVNDEGNMDETLLHYLAGDGYIDAVELMLNNGANINHPDITGNTPLDYAKWKNRTSVIEPLKKRGGKSGDEIC